MRAVSRFFLATALYLGCACAAHAVPSNDIVFVTQPPFPDDFATVNSTFANHRASLDSAPRGGDLYIRYADGSLRNLTAAAGYGTDGFQGANAIAVRDPAVHWSGTKIIFSMTIGSSTQQYVYGNFRWQLYEITNFGKGQTPVITRVTNQPESYNNVMPVYTSDDKIIFVSDRPHNGATHLYPQRDEYESTATNTGLWKLNPSTGSLTLLDHAPSGDFTPTIDSFGRVIFTRWDHLQRDQQVGGETNPFNYASEAQNAERINSTSEVFPEPLYRGQYGLPANVEPHSLNHFFPWSVNQDGTNVETINHVGRQELIEYLPRSFNDDENLLEFASGSTRVNQNPINNFFTIRESLTTPGLYYGIDAPEFRTHSAGQIISLWGPPTITADQMTVQYITSRATASYSDSPSAEHSGLYRDPLPLSNGELIAVHTNAKAMDTNIGTRSFPQSRYSFRLKTLRRSGAYYVADQLLTSGITKSLWYWDPDYKVTYTNVTMWELQPVEVLARELPPMRTEALPAPEQSVLIGLNVERAELVQYLRNNNLALIVSRNVTTRDRSDTQQPFNLEVEDSSTATIASAGKVYPVAFLQILQGDLIRGYGGTSDPERGRRVLARPMHGVAQNVTSSGPSGTVKIADDGSFAAFVPARRALTWHLINSNQKSVVKERFWLTFQPGEIRVCASCHGINSESQVGLPPPTNPPQALDALLRHWKGLPPAAPTRTPTPTSENSSRVRVGVSVTKVRSTALATTLRFTVRPKNIQSIGVRLALSTSAAQKSCGVVHRLTTRPGSVAFLLTVPKRKQTALHSFILRYRSNEVARKRIAIKGSVRGSAASQSCPRLRRSR